MLKKKLVSTKENSAFKVFNITNKKVRYQHILFDALNFLKLWFRECTSNAKTDKQIDR